MAHYKVETSNGLVEFDHPDANLSQAQVQRVINDNHPQSPGYQVPPMLQSIAQGITMPGRGLRGIGVGLEQLATNPSQPANAVMRANAAVQPGFQPQNNEGIGAFAAGQLDPINLAVGKLFPGGSVAKAMKGGAVGAGGSSLLDQMAQGTVKPGNVAIDALMGSGGGAVAHNIGTMASGFVDKAPGIFKRLANIPEHMTNILRDNPGLESSGAQGKDAINLDVMDKTRTLQKSLGEFIRKSSQEYEGAIDAVGASKTSKQKVASAVMPYRNIPQAVESLERYIPTLQAGQKDPSALSPENTSMLFKTLLNLRRSIGEHIDPGNKAITGEQKQGLIDYKDRVVNMMRKLSGYDVLNSADKKYGAAKDIFATLTEKMKGAKEGVNVGDAIDFVHKTLSSDLNDPKGMENMRNLLALEEVTGKPIINDLMKAMTKAKFSENLAGNGISRTIAGASPFLVSALMRIAGVPFQASLPASAALATASQSPAMLAKALRAAQASVPYQQPASQATAVTALNAIRQRRSQNQE